MSTDMGIETGSSPRREAELARSVVTELQRQGYETYEEVSAGGRRADIVALRGPVLMVVECKVSLSLKLLDQLTLWQGEANYLIGAVEPTRFGVTVARYMAQCGFGLWSVTTGEIFEKIAPRLHRRRFDGFSSLRNQIRAEHKSGLYADAGTQGGGYWTPFRGTCKALCEIVGKQPGIELRAALVEAGHHYASVKSAMSSMPGLIRKGVVAGVRLDVEGRALRLYPSVDVAQSAQASTE